MKAPPDNETQALIDRNIRRSLGVFSVPTYLSNGDPADKYGTNANCNRAQPGLRYGLQPAVPHAWWQETIAQERRAAILQDPSRALAAPSPAAAASSISPPPPPPPASRSYCAPPAPGAGASLAYYPAGVTQHNGQPHLVYMPYWLPAAASSGGA